MTDVLTNIDRALDNLCPCGATPRAGSTYCSDDCTPTHIAEHTDVREHGDYATPMRWRPDLVTACDDSSLEPVEFEHCGYTGRYNPQVFRRDDNTLHLRLDDGHRFVGCDVENDHSEVWPPEFVERMFTAWGRLDRELSDSRQVEGDPWDDVFNHLIARRVEARRRQELMVARLVEYADRAPRTGQPVTYTFTDEPPSPPASSPATAPHPWASPAGNPVRDIEAFREQWTRQADIYRAAFTGVAEGLAAAFAPIGRVLAEVAASAHALDPVEAEHPMLRAIELRRNRNTGPQPKRRTPRQINPRRGR